MFAPLNMATAILRPQDPLRQTHRFRSEMTFQSPPLTRRRNPNPNANPGRRKQILAGFLHNAHRTRGRLTRPSPAKNSPVMGQVKILKRGEELAKLEPPNGPDRVETGRVGMGRAFGEEGASLASTGRAPGGEDAALSSTGRLGPDPETVQMEVYAGTASFMTSPPPSCVPLPAFFAKEKRNDVATNDLRRLLRLDVV